MGHCRTGELFSGKATREKTRTRVLFRQWHFGGVRSRSWNQESGFETNLYQQLNGLQPLRLQARRELLRESSQHPAVKLLRQIPSIGPIRAAGCIAADTSAFWHQTAALGASGSGTWTESVLYSFRGGNDGEWQAANVLFGKGGATYGTTTFGGNNGTCPNTGKPPYPGCGTVFEFYSLALCRVGRRTGCMLRLSRVFSGPPEWRSLIRVKKKGNRDDSSGHTRRRWRHRKRRTSMT